MHSPLSSALLVVIFITCTASRSHPSFHSVSKKSAFNNDTWKSLLQENKATSIRTLSFKIRADDEFRSTQSFAAAIPLPSTTVKVLYEKGLDNGSILTLDGCKTITISSLKPSLPTVSPSTNVPSLPPLENSTMKATTTAKEKTKRVTAGQLEQLAKTSPTEELPLQMTAGTIVSGQKEKREKSGENRTAIGIGIVVIVLVLVLIAIIVGVVLMKKKKTKKEPKKGKKSMMKTISSLQSFNQGATIPGSIVQNSQKNTTKALVGLPLEPRNMESGEVNEKNFQFMGPLVVNFGVKGPIRHGTEGQKSHSLKNPVVFDSKLNKVYDIGSNIEKLEQSEGKLASIIVDDDNTLLADAVS